MNRFSILQKILLYLAIILFLTFILLPFFEMFMASLRPLEHLFRSPYQFWSNDMSFKSYSDIWVTVPLLGRYIFNSVFLATITTVLSMIFVVPAAYSYARFKFRGKQISLGLFLGVNMHWSAVCICRFNTIIQSCHVAQIRYLQMFKVQSIY